MNWFLAVGVDFILIFAQVLLILRSQVGPTLREVHSLVGGSFLAFVVDNNFYFSYVFPYLFCSPNRLCQKLRHMDFDTFLHVQFEHHSLVSFVLASFSFAFLCSEV